MRDDIGAYLIDLLCEIAEKCSGAVRSWVWVEAHKVCVCAWVGAVDKSSDGAEAFAFIAFVFSALSGVGANRCELTYHLNRAKL